MKKVLILVLPFLLSFSSPEQRKSNELVNLISSQLKQGKRLIAFGETHQHKSLYTLLEKPLKSKYIQKEIDVIIVEFGNSFYQDVLDQYIKGENVSIDELRVVWRNTFLSPNTVWDSPVYENFFITIREINKTISSGKKYRVIAAGKPIDWTKIQTKNDLNSYNNNTRTEQIYEVVGNQVFVKNQKAVLIAGGWHTTQLNLELKSKNGYSFQDINSGKKIDLYFPGSSFVINSYSKLTSLEIDEIKTIKIGAAILTNKTWLQDIKGEKLVFIKGRGGRPDYNPYQNYKLKDIADAIIHWGPKEDWIYERPMKETYQDEDYWNELNRRSLLKWNKPMDNSLRK